MTRTAAIGNIAGIVLAATATVLSPVPARAQATANPGHDAPRFERVSYAGLDLGSGPDRRELDRRIVRAARLVCANGGVRELSIVIQEQQCVRTAIAAARTRTASLVARSRLAAAGSGPNAD